MLEQFFKSQIATVSDSYQCNRITDALAAAGIKFYCKTKDVEVYHGGICGQRKCGNGIPYRTHLAQSRKFLKKLLTVPLGVGLSYQWRR